MIKAISADDFTLDEPWPILPGESLRICGSSWSIDIQAGAGVAAILRHDIGSMSEPYITLQGLEGFRGSSLKRLTVSGGMKFVVGDHCSIMHLDCPHNIEDAPTVEIAAAASIINFTGFAHFGSIEGSLGSTHKSNPGRMLSLGGCVDGRVTGVDITHLPVVDLKHMECLAVFLPHVKSLYELAGTYDPISSRQLGLSWHCWKVRRGWSDGWAFRLYYSSENRNPQEIAYWFKGLSSLISSVPLPASTRTAVRWCYTLLEHQLVDGRGPWVVDRSERRCSQWERVGHWLYRCLGYGCRPLRPLMSWVIMSLLVSIPSVLMHSESNNFTVSIAEESRATPGWVDILSNVIFSPWRVILQDGSGMSPLLPNPTLNVLAHVAVAVPLVGFTIAVKRYFASPLNGRLAG